MGAGTGGLIMSRGGIATLDLSLKVMAVMNNLIHNRVQLTEMSSDWLVRAIDVCLGWLRKSAKLRSGTLCAPLEALTLGILLIQGR
jgi:hypothetical protein